jgi:hypothetical protein
MTCERVSSGLGMQYLGGLTVVYMRVKTRGSAHGSTQDVDVVMGWDAQGEVK